MANELKSVKEERAEELLTAVRTYLEQTARKHDCVGWNCRVCSVDGERGLELKDDLLHVMRSWVA